MLNVWRWTAAILPAHSQGVLWEWPGDEWVAACPSPSTPQRLHSGCHAPSPSHLDPAQTPWLPRTHQGKSSAGQEHSFANHACWHVPRAFFISEWQILIFSFFLLTFHWSLKGASSFQWPTLQKMSITSVPKHDLFVINKEIQPDPSALSLHHSGGQVWISQQSAVLQVHHTLHMIILYCI